MTEQNEQTHTREIGWEAKAINEAFTRTGIKYTASNADTLAAFGREVQFDDDGQPHALYDSEILPLEDALTRWAADQAEGVCDRRTLPRSAAGRPGGSEVTSREDLRTVKDRSDFITKFGLDTYEKLPAKTQVTKELVTHADFRALSLAQKTRIIRENPDILSKLKHTPNPDQVAGAYVNRELLERQKRLQGR